MAARRGSYPTLEIYTEVFPRIIVGNPECARFIFSIPHQEIDNGVLYAADDFNLRNFLRLTIGPHVALLFPREFSHLKIATRLDVVSKWPFIKRISVLSYVMLPQEIRHDPEMIRPYVVALSNIEESLRKARFSLGPESR